MFGVGGGGSGGVGDRGNGGGGGGFTKTAVINGVKDGSINISIGSSNSNTIIGDITISAGDWGSHSRGANGGSGGGCAAYDYWVDRYGGSNGASNGGNASDGASSFNDRCKGGIGQGTTTRAFGESTGTLYAGGGGGGGTPFTGSGSGGAGGGANGNSGYLSGNDAQANTGGGGGGGSTDAFNGIRGGNGGSGIVIIRWGY